MFLNNLFHKIKFLGYSLMGILFFISCDTIIKEASTAKLEANTIETTAMPAANPLSAEFKTYWYAGDAEITSYELQQARYGEIREGKAVLIYVTEDFLADKQVKADRYSKENIGVLKLNATKKFNTGIYPYSIMSSTFYPVSNNRHALKVSSSMQEWCGHVYAQLNNRDNFEVDSHSYFESEADQQLTFEKTVLENELWNQLRIAPESLPLGQHNIIPSFEFIRLKHIEMKAYKANASLVNNGDESLYTIEYPELDRSLSITFSSAFPYEIQAWEETFKSGFGPKATMLTTKAKKIKTIKSSYWTKNSNSDEGLREELGLVKVNLNHPTK